MSGSNTGTDMRSDESAYNDKDVQNSVAAHLAALRDGKGSEPPTPEPKDTEELEADDASSLSDSDQDDAADADNEPSPTQDDDPGPEAGEEKLSIPENVYRSVLHNGWKPEEVAEFYKASPKQALKVFEKLHASTNDLSRQFAEIGRTRIEMRKQPQDGSGTAEKPAAVIDIEAIRKADPDNPLLPALEGMNKVLTQLTTRREAEPPQRQQANAQEDIALATQVMSFLGSDQMKLYGDFYGPAYDADRMPTFDGRGLTPGQRANRDALLEQADAIWVGAKEHGRNLTVPEALGLAHSLLTDGMRTEKVRQELVSKVKQRSKGMTLRPGKSKPATIREGEKPKTEKELELRTEARLTALRNKK